jgi:hypothetical protein
VLARHWGTVARSDVGDVVAVEPVSECRLQLLRGDVTDPGEPVADVGLDLRPGYLVA